MIWLFEILSGRSSEMAGRILRSGVGQRATADGGFSRAGFDARAQRRFCPAHEPGENFRQCSPEIRYRREHRKQRRFRGLRACRSWDTPLPALRHPEPPCREQMAGRECGIKLRIALRQSRAAGGGKFCVVQMCLGKKTEPLENCTIAELLRVADQKVAVVGRRLLMCGQAVGNVIDSAARVRHGPVSADLNWQHIRWRSNNPLIRQRG